MCFSKDYDRIRRNSDGQKFYGFDDDDGKTDWYDGDGFLDCVTDTPTEDEEEYSSWSPGLCPYCNGTGYDPLDGGQCERCAGTGEIAANVDDDD